MNPQVHVIDDPDIPVAPAYAFVPDQSNDPSESGRFSLPKQKSKVLEEPQIQALRKQGFTKGLAKALTANNVAFPLRVWVVDNSGSMSKSDGHRIVETSDSKDVKFAPCTRWREIQETVSYHSQMAALLEAPTIFRLLNDPGARSGAQQFSIAEKGISEFQLQKDLETANQTMQKTSPGGVTPLAKHIREIKENVSAMAQTLIQDGTKVAIVLATDGIPTDDHGVGGNKAKDEFINAIRSLEGLPVWVVVRLCTDEEHVVSFYNNLDAQLELSLEVLDDFTGEAKEVYEQNNWLNYALPLHRCREMGYFHRLFDLLDERKLTRGEIRDFCMLLFGDAEFDGVPDPDADWNGFLKAITDMTMKEGKQWNPIKRKPTAWIDLKKLDQCYGDSPVATVCSCTIM